MLDFRITGKLYISQDGIFFYQESHFAENVTVKELEALDVDVLIDRWSDNDQHQLHHEALQWLDYDCDEIEGLCLETEQHSMQKRVKTFGDKRKLAKPSKNCIR